MINDLNDRNRELNRLLFRCWLIATVLLSLLFLILKQGYGIVAMIGQLFLVSGLIATIKGFKKHVFNPFFLLSPLASLFYFAIVIRNFLSLSVKDAIDLFWISLILSAGILMLTTAYEHLIGKRIRCRQKVKAICVDTKRTFKGSRIHGSGSTTHSTCAVYEITLNGKTYRTCPYGYSAKLDIDIGDSRTIRVNRSNPMDSFDGRELYFLLFFVLVAGVISTLLSFHILLMFLGIL